MRDAVSLDAPRGCHDERHSQRRRRLLCLRRWLAFAAIEHLFAAAMMTLFPRYEGWLHCTYAHRADSIFIADKLFTIEDIFAAALVML